MAARPARISSRPDPTGSRRSRWMKAPAVSRPGPSVASSAGQPPGGRSACPARRRPVRIDQVRIADLAGWPGPSPCTGCLRHRPGGRSATGCCRGWTELHLKDSRAAALTASARGTASIGRAITDPAGDLELDPERETTGSTIGRLDLEGSVAGARGADGNRCRDRGGHRSGAERPLTISRPASS